MDFDEIARFFIDTTKKVFPDLYKEGFVIFEGVTGYRHIKYYVDYTFGREGNFFTHFEPPLP